MIQKTVSLCIDVGGTKLEYCFVSQGKEPFKGIPDGRLLCCDFKSFYQALDALVAEAPAQVQNVAIGAAGPVHSGTVSFTNTDWSIDLNIIKQRFGFERTVLVNDLSGLVWGIDGLQPSGMLTLKDGDCSGGIKVVVAPGTGLGVGIGIGTDAGFTAMPSEGGHISFSPRSQEERDLLAFMAISLGHVSAESVCSGIGLGALFRFITRDNPCTDSLDHHGLGPWLFEQVESEGEYCGQALKVYQLFFDLLAEVCGNLAVTALPDGGLYLAGGLMGKLAPFMDKERFIKRFMDRSVQQSLLESVAILQIVHPNPVLVGCNRMLLAGV